MCWAACGRPSAPESSLLCGPGFWTALATWLEVEGNGPVTASESRQYAIFREAERCFTAGSGDQFTVDSLADAIGVSRRSLYYAFNASIGVGPRRYFEVQRLHWMREELLRSRPDARTVTEVATELEIGDLGRLAARYRELFGEYPSQSLARVLDGSKASCRSAFR